MEQWRDKPQIKRAAEMIKLEYPDIDLERVAEIIEAAFWSESNVARFLSDWCRYTYAEAGSETKQVFAAYQKWCELNNEVALGRNLFGNTLKQMGLRKRFLRDRRYWRGLVLIRRT